jgi:GntR family transcriptional regulator
VAVAIRVDLNTVRHAYDDLERMGAILLIRGRGSFVSDNPPKRDEKAAARKAEALARQTLAAAAAAGVDPSALARRIIELSNGETS